MDNKKLAKIKRSYKKNKDIQYDENLTSKMIEYKNIIKKYYDIISKNFCEDLYLILNDNNDTINNLTKLNCEVNELINNLENNKFEDTVSNISSINNKRETILCADRKKILRLMKLHETLKNKVFVHYKNTVQSYKNFIIGELELSIFKKYDKLELEKNSIVELEQIYFEYQKELKNYINSFIPDIKKLICFYRFDPCKFGIHKFREINKHNLECVNCLLKLEIEQNENIYSINISKYVENKWNNVDPITCKFKYNDMTKQIYVNIAFSDCEIEKLLDKNVNEFNTTKHHDLNYIIKYKYIKQYIETKHMDIKIYLSTNGIEKIKSFIQFMIYKDKMIIKN